MEDIEIAKKKDIILELLLGKDGVLTFPLTSKEIVHHFGNDQDLEYYTRLIDDIKNHPDGIAKYINHKPTGLKPNSFTQIFLNNGGFVGLFNAKKEIEKEKFQLAAQDKKVKKLQEENLTLNNRLSKQKLKTHLLPIGISIISLVFAAYSLLKPNDSISQEVIDTKVESLEEDIKRIEIEYKKENEGLKDRLYKAELLIAVYEEAN